MTGVERRVPSTVSTIREGETCVLGAAPGCDRRRVAEQYRTRGTVARVTLAIWSGVA